MGLFQGLFTAPSWQSFLFLACWLGLLPPTATLLLPICGSPGATTVKALPTGSSRPPVPTLYTQRWHLWGRIYPRGSPLCPQVKSLWSLLTIRPRKKLAHISRGSAATAMALAPPGKNTAHCGGFATSFWALTSPPSRGGPVTVSASRLVSNSILKPDQAKAQTRRIVPRSQLARDIHIHGRAGARSSHP